VKRWVKSAPFTGTDSIGSPSRNTTSVRAALTPPITRAVNSALSDARPSPMVARAPPPSASSRRSGLAVPNSFT
jgi:hypothetical protein